MFMKKEIIETIISKTVKQKIKNIRSIVGKGDVNKIFVVELENRKVLLRINSKWDGLMEFKKEVWCIEKSKKKGVPCSNILGVGMYKDYSYMIYDFIQGRSGGEIKNKKEVWVTIGRYAKLINSVKVKGYGLRFSPEDNRFTESWSRHIRYNIESLNEEDKLLDLKIYDKDQLIMIKKYFFDLKKNKFKIGLIHNDLSLRNVVVNDVGDVFLIDWGCAEANFVPLGEFVEILGAGHMDLKIPTSEEIDCFLKGYGISKKEFEILKKDISKFLLLVSFDKLRWAIDKSLGDVKEMSKIARKRL
ncbi:MAG TPA: hypothetical protein ENH20_00150, partial [Candidatus Pacearchaeota archaeon]|nr:hypothetical protein [Candidatus Pacearchaeota archaeon]